MSASLELLIAAVLGIAPDRVTDNLEFQSIPEWDSLNHVNLMLALESRFGTVIDADRIVELTSVVAIRAFAAEQSKGGHPT